ncbi:MAG: AMP-binding protein [Cellvibrionales bacterium]
MLQHRNTTLVHAAQERAEKHGDEIAIYFDDGSTLSYGEAWADGLALAGALYERGLRPRDRVSFQLPNCRESVVVMLAAAIGGWVINPIVPIYRDRETGYILRHAGSKAIFIPTSIRGFDYPAMVGRLRADCAELTTVVVIGADETADDQQCTYAQLLRSGYTLPHPPHEADPDDEKILLYTSGTTGHPKQVRHSHNSLTAALDLGVIGWNLGDDDLMLMPSPVTHITGYVNGMEMPFLTGTKSLLMGQWQVDRAIDLIEQYGATACVSATPFLRELVDACQAADKSLPGFRLFACGGASVPPDLIHDAWNTLRDCRAVRVYGSTEVPLVTVGFTGADQRTLAAETDGRISDYEVKVVDEDGRDVGLDQDGEILARGAAMMLGYGDPEQNSDAFDGNGFFRTGDIGRKLANGGLLITDRKKDIIIRGGENISARDIEEVLLRMEGVAEVAVVSVPHQRLGETVGACLVMTDGRPLDQQALVTMLRDSGLAKQKWPQHIEFMSALPKTASGKVQKEILRRQLREQGIVV